MEVQLTNAIHSEQSGLYSDLQNSQHSNVASFVILRLLEPVCLPRTEKKQTFDITLLYAFSPTKI